MLVPAAPRAGGAGGEPGPGSGHQNWGQRRREELCWINFQLQGWEPGKEPQDSKGTGRCHRGSEGWRSPKTTSHHLGHRPRTRAGAGVLPTLPRALLEREMAAKRLEDPKQRGRGTSLPGPRPGLCRGPAPPVPAAGAGDARPMPEVKRGRFHPHEGIKTLVAASQRGETAAWRLCCGFWTWGVSAGVTPPSPGPQPCLRRVPPIAGSGPVGRAEHRSHGTTTSQGCDGPLGHGVAAAMAPGRARGTGEVVLLFPSEMRHVLER